MILLRYVGVHKYLIEFRIINSKLNYNLTCLIRDQHNHLQHHEGPSDASERYSNCGTHRWLTISLLRNPSDVVVFG